MQFVENVGDCGNENSDIDVICASGMLAHVVGARSRVRPTSDYLQAPTFVAELTAPENIFKVFGCFEPGGAP
jgi:hypothetical protein